MSSSQRAFPAVLGRGEKLAILAGYFILAGVCLGMLIGVDRWHIPWLNRIDWRIRGALFLLPVLTYSALVARRHRSYTLAVFGSLLGCSLASVAGVSITAFTEADDEFGPRTLIIMLSPIFSALMWVPSVLAGIGAVRVARGRWGRPRMGRCPACGYDLAGLMSMTCPECGANCAITKIPDGDPN